LARALIVGCGCHGRELGRHLAASGWRVRGTTRDPGRHGEVEAAGLEAALADPERPGTVLELCGDVTVVVWLLGSAAGPGEGTGAIHGPRLERLLEKLVDSPVRGFAYEASGSAPEPQLAAGRDIVERAGRSWRIPVGFIEGERAAAGWAKRAARTVIELPSL
jgi:uncharacterized protein YbjT (DUF2867 family)